MPAVGTPHTAAAPAEWDEVQSGLRAADDPPPTVRVAVTAARPPRAKPAPRRRAAQPSDASPAAQVDLRTLGYSQQQQEKIKPKVRSTVAQHHEALVGHGFTHAHIVALSQHPAALGTVAVTYQDIIRALPEATHEDIVGVGNSGPAHAPWRPCSRRRGVERSAVTVGHRPTSQDCKTWRRDRSGGSACMAQCTDGCP